MKGRLILGLAAVALVVVVGGAYAFGSSALTPVQQTPVAQTPTETAPTPTPTQTPTPTPTPVQSGYTLADVAKHSSQSSCWSAINGNVYDLTRWINQHPGGPDAILSICGTDGSAAFNAQHGGQGRPAQELTNFYIADLM